jgi:hypothetical protein
MLYINEWFPNPVGNDSADEFIELYNSGDAPINLNGYQLSDGAKKRFLLNGYTIPARGYLTLNKSQTKFTLKNTDGGLWLYGQNGVVIDQAHFTGAAVEGKSFSRVDYGATLIEHFAFLYSTPGAKNKSYDNVVAKQDYSVGASLTHQFSLISFLILTISISLSLLLFFFYVTKKNRNISHFFFGGDQKIGL